MAIWRCSWCGKTFGLAPDVAGAYTDGICDACTARMEAEAALSHALVGLRAITAEIERAKAHIWNPTKEGI